MRKKLLTLEDLVKFCKAQKMYSFSANDEDGPIYVHIPASFKKKNVEDPAFLYVDLKAFHTGKNRNDSSVTYDAAKKSLDTFAYKPILAAFMTDENGEEDFMSHEMEQDEDGNVIYIEQPVGCFTTDKPKMEKDPDNDDRYYIYASGVIYREYSHAAEIIERKNGTKVSVELMVNEFQYDEKEDLLLLTDIEVSGITLLGKYEDGSLVEEGMEGARLDIKDFSRDNNSVFAKEEIKQFIQDSIKEALDNFKSQRKEENNQMNHFNELLEKYGKTVEEITFAYEGLSDEELDAAFAEAFEKAPDTEGTEPQNDEPQGENVEFSVTYKGETKTFSKSLNDKIKEITELINATYGYEDNAYYDCEVFDETKTVLFHDWWNGKHFRQKYGTKEGNLALKGERTEVFVRYLSEDELAALDELNTKFEAATKELNSYHDEPEKMKVLESEAYSALSSNKDFINLKKEDVHFNMSIEEVTKKADEILLAAAKAGNVDFSKKETSPKKPIVGTAKVSGKYGNLIKDAKGLH